MRKALLLLLGVAILAALAVPALGLGGGDGRKVLNANTLAPVIEPYTGTANPIRGVNGGGLPWELKSGSAQSPCRRPAARPDPRPRARSSRARSGESPGNDPFAQLRAVVSCLTTTNGLATTDNISTGLTRYVTPRGDGHLDTSVALPSPCFAPIVFVTAPTGAWFAITGR